MKSSGKMSRQTTKSFGQVLLVVFSVMSFKESTAMPLVVTTSAPTCQLFRLVASEPIPPEIYSFRVESDIMYRYSRTLITSRVANRETYLSQEVTFRVVLPEAAFISHFVMEIDGISFEAYVKEKDKAKEEYHQAQKQGKSAGLVEKSTRNSNLFLVKVNLKPQSTIAFSLTYEELLTSTDKLYELPIDINPNQATAIQDYQIVVNVEESRSLTVVRVPSLSNDINAQDENGNNPYVDIQRTAPNKATITWNPSPEEQERLWRENNFGQFRLQYGLDRKKDAGQILLMHGYFVHFFSPDDLPPLRKHVVFILDISGSMHGRKLEQLKEAQNKILDDLLADDYFNILTFSSGVNHWFPGNNTNEPIPASPGNVNKAKTFIDSLTADGWTDIHGALTQALSLIETIKAEQAFEFSGRWLSTKAKVQSLIIFLTDGEPTEGVTSTTEIQNRVRTANQKLSVPIYSLGFGYGVDFEFLKKLSLQNNGFARKIYEASDAALQLFDFYTGISSPLLSNVTFSYTSNEFSAAEVTLKKLPTVFGGAEITVAGKLAIQSVSGDGGASYFLDDRLDNTVFDVRVEGVGRQGQVTLSHAELRKIEPTARNTLFSTSDDNYLERLWAYLTISKLINENDSNEDGNPETSKQKALRLALRYGFVTPLTSLLVVKPDTIDVTNLVSADDWESAKIQQASRASIGGNVPLTQTHTPTQSGSQATPAVHQHTVQSQRGVPMVSTATANPAVIQYGHFVNPFRIGTTPTPTQSSTPSPRLTLHDVTWLPEFSNSVLVNGTLHVIARAPTSGDNEGFRCYNSDYGARGRCMHLKRCILPAFFNDETTYKDSHFCEISSTSGSELYAGVCCPSKKARATPSSSLVSPLSHSFSGR